MVGTMIGFVVGWYLPLAINLLSNSLYGRDSLEQIMDDYLGHANIKDAMTDELLVVAYNYNHNEPRFFSKWWSHVSPGWFDVKMSIATGASSAAPTFFDPQHYQNQYGLDEYLIDGGIICNNPALYAYQMAH